MSALAQSSAPAEAGAPAELEHFVSAVAHDLQEPARLIAGYAQLLAKRCLPGEQPEAEELVTSLLDGVGQMQERIQGLLDYSRVTSRGEPFQPVQCQPVFARAVSSLAGMVEQSAAVITHDPLPEIQADASQLRKVFEYLLSNAIVFRGEAPPRVHVGVKASPTEWLFSVRDNGIGIETQHTERIFGLFQRLHTRTERPGAGVGLAVSRRIVERHGGRIWVESRPGEGSTFHFTLAKRPVAPGVGSQGCTPER